jgi:hypothetical protein
MKAKFYPHQNFMEAKLRKTALKPSFFTPAGIAIFASIKNVASNKNQRHLYYPSGFLTQRLNDLAPPPFLKKEQF